MRRKNFRLTLDLLLLLSAFLVFTSGLVLLTRFHMGHGTLRMSVLGLDRHVWQNIHRLSAIFVLPCMGTHIALNWRPIISRFTRAFKSGTKHRGMSELVMYLAFPPAVVAGFIAWLVVGDSPSYFGPPVPGRLAPMRHGWIDIHHLSGLVSLPLAVHHVGHRWGWMTRTLNDYLKTVSLL